MQVKVAPQEALLLSPGSEHLFCLGDCLGRIQTFRAGLGAIHDRMATVQLEGIVQIIQSLIAVGSGGILGNGFMRSQQKLFYLPEPHSDFIFAVIGEEFGFVGAIALLALYLIVIMTGINEIEG